MNRLPEPHNPAHRELPLAPPLEGTLPRGANPGHGVLFNHPPLDSKAATEIAFLPSVAQEISLHLVRADTPGNVDPTRPSISIVEDGRPKTLNTYLLAEETYRPGAVSELFWAQSNRTLRQQLSSENRGVLETIHQLAEERELSIFGGRYLRGLGGPIPLGRLLTGIAGELLENPLTPLGLVCADGNKARFRWYLVDDSSAERQLHRRGPEHNRLRLCREAIEEGFIFGHLFIENPLDAVLAVAQRFGLIGGKSDETTAYITAPNTPDVTGEPLSLIVRPGSPEDRVPGLQVCWAHHDAVPRPPETCRR